MQHHTLPAREPATPAAGVPTPQGPVPTSGALQVRVRYAECDPMGVVYHGAYIPWLEMGRTELLRSTGVTYAEMERAGAFLVIVKLECSYKRPAFYDDVLEVRTRAVGFSRVKIRHEYEIVRAHRGAGGGGVGDKGGVGGGAGGAGDLIMTATTLLACVDASGRPTPLPDWLASLQPAGAPPDGDRT